MKIAALEIKNAQAVADLEVLLFSEKQRLGLLTIKEIILNNKRFRSKIALGLFDGHRLVGYILAYPEGFRPNIQSRFEKYIYISDFAVLPEFRNHAAKLILRVISNGRPVFPSRPCIVDAFEYYKDKWIEHEALFRRYGYKLVSCDRERDEFFHEDIFSLRFEPINIKVHSEKDRYSFAPVPFIVYHLFRVYAWISQIFK